MQGSEQLLLLQLQSYRNCTYREDFTLAGDSFRAHQQQYPSGRQHTAQQDTLESLAEGQSLKVTCAVQSQGLLELEKKSFELPKSIKGTKDQRRNRSEIEHSIDQPQQLWSLEVKEFGAGSQNH